MDRTAYDQRGFNEMDSHSQYIRVDGRDIEGRQMCGRGQRVRFECLTRGNVTGFLDLKITKHPS